jgi:hypothetical protein
MMLSMVKLSGICLILSFFNSICAMEKIQQQQQQSQQEKTTPAYRGVLIFLDDSEYSSSHQSFRPVTSALLSALYQEAGPIIASGSLIDTIFSAYNSGIELLKAHNLKNTPENLLNFYKKNNNYTNDKEIIALAAGIDPSKWIIKDLSKKNYQSSLYLFIPKSYLINNGIDPISIAKSDLIDNNQIVSDIELHFGLKVNHVKTIENITEICNARTARSDYIISRTTKQAKEAQYFQSSFCGNNKAEGSIFCLSEEYKQSEKSIQMPQWSIFMLGHGLTDEYIVWLELYTFQGLLNFLQEKIHTRLLVVDSCYSAGENIEKLYIDLNTNIHKTYNYPIITHALTDTTVELGDSGKTLSVFEQDKQLKFDTANCLNYKSFFDRVTTQDKIDFSQAINYIFTQKRVEDTPQIKLPGIKWFRLIKQE